MCLVALAIDQNRRFPLVVAANRDEFFLRPAARLAWWTPPGGGPDVLSGRDLESGETWLGLTAQGRLALLTNIRDPSRIEADAPSRGRIVPEWLTAQETAGQFWMRTALSGHNGFNLIAAGLFLGVQFACAECHNHPFAEWKQTEFWNLAAFFSQVRAPGGRPIRVSVHGPKWMISLYRTTRLALDFAGEMPIRPNG